MDTYKAALEAEGWGLIGKSDDGDYRLLYDHALADLLDFGDYILVSFTTTELQTPMDAIIAMSQWFDGNPQLVDQGVYGLYGAYGAANNPVEDIIEYAEMVMQYIFEDFELAVDWAEDASGNNSAVYANAINTAINFNVYSDTLYVNEQGYIVDEGTEGATAVEATCIEIYTYTVTLA